MQYALYGHLASGLPPVPYWYRPNHTLAYVTAALLIASGLALLADWRVHLMSLLLGLYFLAGCLLHLGHFEAILFRSGPRTAFFQPLALAAAALVLHGLIAPSTGRLTLLPGRILFAVAMIVFGIQHLLYADTASLIPKWGSGWIHFHHLWLVLTGVALIAAGMAILVRRADRFAALSLSVMFFGWLILLHIPLILGHPRNGHLWRSGFVVLGLCGASLILAASAHAAPSRGGRGRATTRKRA